MTTISMLTMLVLACGGAPEPVWERPVAPAATPDRKIAIDGRSNFRSLGGYDTADGRTVPFK